VGFFIGGNMTKYKFELTEEEAQIINERRKEEARQKAETKRILDDVKNTLSKLSWCKSPEEPC
jgi:hypothetical protein